MIEDRIISLTLHRDSLTLHRDSLTLHDYSDPNERDLARAKMLKEFKIVRNWYTTAGASAAYENLWQKKLTADENE